MSPGAPCGSTTASSHARRVKFCADPRTLGRYHPPMAIGRVI
jgi:hypothetical protein